MVKQKFDAGSEIFQCGLYLPEHLDHLFPAGWQEAPAQRGKSITSAALDLIIADPVDGVTGKIKVPLPAYYQWASR